MTRFALLLSLFMLTGACTAAPKSVAPVTPVDYVTTVVGQTLVKCVYKYDSTLNIEFLLINKVEYRSAYFPDLIVYHITDTTGKRWSINSYEMENYNCTETQFPKG